MAQPIHGKHLIKFHECHKSGLPLTGARIYDTSRRGIDIVSDWAHGPARFQKKPEYDNILTCGRHQVVINDIIIVRLHIKKSGYYVIILLISKKPDSCGVSRPPDGDRE